MYNKNCEENKKIKYKLKLVIFLSKVYVEFFMHVHCISYSKNIYEALEC